MTFLLLVLVSGPGNFCLVHVSLVPVLNVVGEQVSQFKIAVHSLEILALIYVLFTKN